ncbi:acyl-CoA thioesterase [Salinibacterium sp. dk2585]|nr:acyl-CoA thioesterase [Salinibacterium sp. dk2585]TXK54215.1 acyl-CoA thioesterase [Salinibacterium sp. dk5596]
MLPGGPVVRIHVPVHLRWGDLDAYNHVNNVEVFRILEEARVRAFWASDDSRDEPLDSAVFEPGGSSLSLISGHRIEYIRPLAYQRAPVDVQLWFTSLSGARATIGYELFDGASPTVYARASSTMVFVEEDGYRPRRMTREENAAWAPYLGEPVSFSGRG